VKLSVRALSLVAPLSLLAACGGSTPPPASAPAEASVAPAASAAPVAAAVSAAAPIVVAIASKSGSKLTGTATFTEVEGGVKVNLQVAGVPPGKVATHVHETGDCSAPDAKSAGGHFNPEHHPHALPPSGERHLGDLGNIDIGPDGKGSLEIVAKGANLKAGDPDSFLGRAIIVHEKLDDGGQPTGNAGGRIGCGVIAAAK
jgi:superoxide dismutase, Cu-Zn family